MTAACTHARTNLQNKQRTTALKCACMSYHTLLSTLIMLTHHHTPAHNCSLSVNQNRLVQPFQLDPVQLDPDIYVTRLVIGWIEIHWIYIVHWIWPMLIWRMRISTNITQHSPCWSVRSVHFVSNETSFQTNKVSDGPSHRQFARNLKIIHDTDPRNVTKQLCARIFSQESTFPTLAHTHAPLHANLDTHIQVRSSRPSNNVQQDMVFAPRKGDRILCINYRELVPPVNWLDVDPPGKANAWNTEVLSVSKNGRTYECDVFNA